MINDKIIRETFLTAYLMKKLAQPVYESQAFLKGIVDASGNLLKRPETIDEQCAYTPVDAYIFKLKTLLGSKLDLLNHKVFLEKVIKNSDLPVELYEKEVQLKYEMSLVISRFKEICNEASGNGLPITVIEKVLLESF
jgi:hypothetical protein